MREVVVSAAIVTREDAFLLTRRPEASHLGGTWEFPGGKVEAGETLQEALVREVLEELGCGAAVGALVLDTRHAYPEVAVHLHFFEVRLTGEPVPQMGQEMRWVPRAALATLPLPEADAELVARLVAGGGA